MTLTPPRDVGPPPGGARHTPAYDVATLETCDAEPIHVPGAIQPHGVLLACADAPGLPVAMCSANLAGLLGPAPEVAVGRPLADVLGPTLAATVADRVAAGCPADPAVVTWIDGPADAALLGLPLDLRVLRTGRGGRRVLVELEPLVRTDGSGEVPEVGGYRAARTSLARLTGADADLGLTGLTDRLAVEVRRLTGFDRVMVYRFDEEWNGEVVAECRREDLNPFLGLHYPASDIPAQARRLYTLNPIRLIADVGYTPVPLHPVLDDDGAALDLSFASLRSVSPIHLEYLGNMGVTASMSVSLLVDGELWGLIACHHYSGPHRPSQEARAAAELVTEVAAHLVSARERADAREREAAARTRIADITARLAAADAPLEALERDPDVRDLVGAGGLAIYAEGRLRVVGAVPPPQLLGRIAARLLAAPEPSGLVGVRATDQLGLLDADLATRDGVAATAAGVLLVGDAERWLMWLRPEQPEVVDWGGDPTNKRLADAEGAQVRLSPRRSFEKWREVTSGRSRPFAPWELRAAADLGRHLDEALVRRSGEQRVVAETLARTVRERVPRGLVEALAARGIEIAAASRPAARVGLGGDWWDVVDSPAGTVLVVGDVAGHGAAAASAMALVSTALRAYLHEGHDPVAALARLDTLIAAGLDVPLVSVVVARLAPAGATDVDVVVAGHPAPWRVPTAPGLAPHAVPVPVGRLVGLGEGADRAAVRVRLEPGDCLVLHSDGLTEVATAGATATFAQRIAEVGADPAGGLPHWCDDVVASVGDGQDDRTVLVLRVRG
ncbi:SpoIIE family protein phosphatase [Nocardioides sp.]|uniref:SpoIIE family protein phosphatase n=1 Tax=Nocardioides sp. TaxID=35761 RepID=UPI00351425A0